MIQKRTISTTLFSGAGFGFSEGVSGSTRVSFGGVCAVNQDIGANDEAIIRDVETNTNIRALVA